MLLCSCTLVLYAMRIKTRLILSFGFFVLLILVWGGISSYLNFKLTSLLTKSIALSRSLSFWRELDFAFSRQSRTIDYFLLFGTSSEKESFNTQSTMINKKLENFLEKKLIAVTDYSKDTMSNWQKNYFEYTATINRLFGVIDGVVIKYFEKNIEPLQKNLFAEISSNIKLYEEEINLVEKEIKNISNTSIIFSMLSGILAFVIAVLLSIVLFRSISTPLRALEIGAKIIGGGDMNYRIAMKNAPPEIKTLSDNFNVMVENLSKLQLQIVQMDRMSSIGQLSGGVAHEINNPLTGVLGQAQLLLEKLPENSPYRPHIQKIESAAQRCRKIVRSLLDFSRDKDYNFVHADVIEILDETIGLLSSEIQQKNIIIRREINPMPKIKISQSHIHQVFLNIITNSIYAMKGGGTLSISTKVNKNFVEISIRDTGVGIKKEYLNHIFDPFFTTKNIGEGTGLGLTVCYGIIQQHNGSIAAESPGEGKGTTITIKLPYCSVP